MNPIPAYLKQAELSLAAYADLSGATATFDDELRGAGMSALQAARFTERWVVVEQYNHSEEIPTFGEFGEPTGYITVSNGLSVTVFQEVGAPQKYLAIRGTDDLADLLTDRVDIASIGTPERQAQYASLKTKVQQWMASGVLPTTFTVSGHSLGGFLAGALVVDFPASVEQAFLYNAPGIGGVSATIRLALKNLMGSADEPAIDLSRVSNIKAAAGISPIAGLAGC